MNETLIESAVTVADIAKATNTPEADVEAEARALDMFVGADWAGRPAVSVGDAAGLASGAARLEHNGRRASLSHQSVAGDQAASDFERRNPVPQYGEAIPESTFGRVVARVKEAVR